jgi:5-methylcytosine-specific restriction endonuclease McrA
MNARQSDNTAPCHYCGTRLRPDNFVLDHKIPISSLSTRKAIQDPTNLVVCCRECNIEKGNKYGYEAFLLMKKETHG